MSDGTVSSSDELTIPMIKRSRGRPRLSDEEKLQRCEQQRKKALETIKQKWISDKDHMLEIKRRYYEKHKEQIQEYHKQYRQKQREYTRQLEKKQQEYIRQLEQKVIQLETCVK